MAKSKDSLDVAEAEKAFDHMESADIRTRFDAAIDKIGNVVSILFLFGMSASVYEVISRYVFDAPTLWAHETTILLVAVGFAFGGSFCLARNSHISIRFLYDGVSPRTRQFLDILNAVLGFLYTAAIAYAAFEMVRKSIWTPQGTFRLETSGSAWNPPIPPIVKTGLLLSIGLMAIQHVLYFIKAVTGGPVAAHPPTIRSGAE